MTDRKCPKCGSDMALREGYGVCNSCGEIVMSTGEEITAVADEVTEVAIEIAEEESELFATQIPEEYPLEETVVYNEEIQESDAEELVIEEIRPEENFYVVPEKKKNKKKSAAPALILILCAMLAVGGYYVVKDMSSSGISEVESFNEEMPPQISTEPDEDEVTGEEVPVVDESVTGPIESLEGETLDEGNKKPAEESGQTTEPAEKPQDTPVTKPVQKPAEKPVVKPAKQPEVSTQQPETEKPVIAYRIRKTAGDSDTQIGAFADFERAKKFAAAHAPDGYKVFDMNGNLVYEP